MVRMSTGKDSKQDVQTPADFIKAYNKRFGAINFDLAARDYNAQAERYYAPPGALDLYAEAYDSLAQDWGALSQTLPWDSTLWLNCEFSNTEQWVRKCAEERPRLEPGRTIALLVPASVGSNWFRDYVYEHADVCLLNGRVQFVGHEFPYPRDLMLCLYQPVQREPTTVHIWNWREDILI